jgi:hypothetical protein
MADSDELAGSHEEDPRVKYSKKRAYSEMLGLFKKAVEGIHDRPEDEEAFRSVLLEWQPGVEEQGVRISNPAVVKGKGRPKGAVGLAKRRVGMPPLPRQRTEAVMGSQTSNLSERSRRPVKCGACGGIGHKRNSRDCPKFVSQVDAGSEGDEGEDPSTAEPVL